MMHLREIARIVRGVLETPPCGTLPSVEGVSTDTRTLRRGDLYFALKGPNFDGHEYVGEAFQKGAVAAVVRRPVSASGPLLRVENVLTALGDLAAVYRMMLGCRVIAVTGSNGKTTVKEMISHLLSGRCRVVRARDSWNNFIGVPLTLFQAGMQVDTLVLELGTNRRGEIARLGSIARPDIGVITSVSESHLEGLESLEGMMREKASLMETLRGNGVGVLPEEPAELHSLVSLPADKRILVGRSSRADWCAEEISIRSSDLSFRLHGVPFSLSLLGRCYVDNALMAVAVASLMGASLEECSERFRSYRPPKMRMEPIRIGDFFIVNDAYNSNPASARQAIEQFASMEGPGRSWEPAPGLCMRKWGGCWRPDRRWIWWWALERRRGISERSARGCTLPPPGRRAFICRNFYVPGTLFF